MASPTLLRRALRAPSCWFALSLTLVACGGNGVDNVDPGEEGGSSSTAGKGGAAGKSGGAGSGGSIGGASGSSAGGNSGNAPGGNAGTSSGGGGAGACPAGKQLCGTACVDLQNDATHCGTCERDCTKANAQYACEVGQCVFKACQTGFGDCNGKPNDGCEVNLAGADACPCAPGQTEPCYTGTDGTEGVGPCKGGTHTCKDDGTGFGACMGQVTPGFDSCADDEDQDCNGTAYKCTGATEICGIGGTCSDPCSASELGTSYIGCVYYPTITPNIVSSVFQFAVAVSNTNDVPVKVAITRAGATVNETTVEPSSVAVIKLPWVPSLKGPDAGFGGSIQPMPGSVRQDGGAYKLTSTRPVTVYQYSPLDYTNGSTFSYTNDASLLLPVNTWRNSYRVAARANFYTSSGFYTVVASENNTTVTLQKGVAPLTIKAGVAGVDTSGNGTVTLNEGDVVTLVTGGNEQAAVGTDPTGTLVTSDKPVQVFGGHQCTFIPSDKQACDHIEESMFPVDTLADQYLVVAPNLPTGTTPKAYIVRFVSVEEGTTLTYDPAPPGAPTTLGAPGSWVEFQTNQNFQVKGSKRFLLAQYALGQDAGGGAGDPDVTLVVPTAQYRTSYLFHAPVNYSSNFVNVTAPTNVAVSLDGTPLGGFAPIGTTGYSFVRVAVPNTNGGNHTITSDQSFGISVYGFGQYTSYWYPGGLDLRVIKD